MKQFALLLLLIIIPFFSIAQKTGTAKSTMIQVINKSIELYNAQNFAALKNVYADNVRVYEFPNTLRDSSLAQLISHYPNTFSKYPNNKAEIFDINIIGNKAICKERITGRGEPFETVLIFEFDKSKIVKVWFISNSSTTPRPGN